jgi:Fur family transcriptional regulator, peroxide stress response regulator
MKNDKENINRMMEGFERVCKTKGLRITHQRTEIFRALLKDSNHPTIENIFEQVRKHLKTISLDTVYRTIATFEKFGLIKKVHHIDNMTRYDHNLSNHHHLVCTQCHKIEDFYWPEFDRMKPPTSISQWGKIEVKHVVIDGLCASCSRKKK